MKRSASRDLALGGFLVLLITGGLGWTLLGKPPVNERGSSTTMKTLCSAQADYFNNDRDGNGIQDYWRGDVAGLYTVKDKATGQELRSIEVAMALADARPLSDLSHLGKRGPKAGYWYQAIRHEDEVKPGPGRFAYCAFPADPNANKYTFIVDENNTIFRKKSVFPPAYFPVDLLKEGWQKLD